VQGNPKEMPAFQNFMNPSSRMENLKQKEEFIQPNSQAPGKDQKNN
jgi:hypothetical protein